MDKEYLIVNNHVTKDGNITEYKEVDEKITVRHFSGINSDNFQVRKVNGKKIEFSFFKLNGIYYITINGTHMLDYNKFIYIQSVENVNENVLIKNIYFGELNLVNCDVDVVQKALEVMSNWIKKQRGLWNQIIYYILKS